MRLCGPLGRRMNIRLNSLVYRRARGQARLDRAQPPTLQQGGSPMFIVLLGWTLAAILSTAVLVLQYDSGSVSLGLPWRTFAKGQFRHNA